MSKLLAGKRSFPLVLALYIIVPALAVTPGVPQLPDPGHPSMSRQDQEKLGLQAAGEVYKQMPVLPDSSPITQYVQHVGAKLLKQIPSDRSWPYQFHVVPQKEINAFALPGGPIFINLGTIEAAQNEAQLAGVMAHEMSHVYMQHSAKQAPKQEWAEIIGALSGVFGDSTLGSLARAGIQFGAGSLLLKYSRADEAQADSVGAIIMYKAGYNPIALANFFEILNSQGGSPPQFLSDHPNPGNRSEAITREIQNWPPKQYLITTPAFETAKKDAASVKAYTAQEISDGAKSGRWASENMQTGSVPQSARASVAASMSAISNVSFEQVKPADTFTETRQNGFAISYPANWTSAYGQNSLTIAPKAAVGENAIAYGVIISATQDQNAGSLDQATQNLIQNLQQSNPGMKQTSNIRSVEVNGVAGREVDLTGSSPVEQNGSPLPEHDRLIVRRRSNGSYLYLIFISPECDFVSLQPAFNRILGSVQVE